MLRSLGHHPTYYLIARKARVAINQPGPGRWRHNKRWIGRDQIERFAVDRRKQATVSDLDVDRIERGCQASHMKRTWIDIGGNDSPGVTGQVKRLDATARAEIQRRANVFADR